MTIPPSAHLRAMLLADLTRGSTDDPDWSRRGKALLALRYGLMGRLVDDAEALALVERFLTIGALGHRQIAAEILVAADRAPGILHLAHNAVSKHPVLGEDQTEISGWNDVRLLRHAHLLSDECIDLLIDDVLAAPHWFHAEVLAAAPSSSAIQRLRRVLQSASGAPAIQAAFALSMHGEQEGRDALLATLADGDVRGLDLAVVALSHHPDEESVAVIRRVADGSHPILKKIPDQVSHPHKPEEWWNFRLREYRSRAAQRLAIVEGRPSLRDLFRRQYGKPQREAWRTSEWANHAGFPHDYTATLLCIDHDKVTNTPDLLCEFSSEMVRSQLAVEQQTAMNALLDMVPESDWFELCRWPFMSWMKRPADSKYWTHLLPEGVKVHCEREDYLFAATDWIRNPAGYRCGSVAITRWDREFRPPS